MIPQDMKIAAHAPESHDRYRVSSVRIKKDRVQTNAGPVKRNQNQCLRSTGSPSGASWNYTSRVTLSYRRDTKESAMQHRDSIAPHGNNFANGHTFPDRSVYFVKNNKIFEPDDGIQSRVFPIPATDLCVVNTSPPLLRPDLKLNFAYTMA